MSAGTSWARGFLWIACAGVVGATAGVPWIWVHTGTLPAAIFAVLAMATAAQQRKIGTQARGWGVPWVLVPLASGIAGAGVVALFGQVGAYAWVGPALLQCIRLDGEAYMSVLEWANRAFAFVVCSAAGAVLHARWRWAVGCVNRNEPLAIDCVLCLLAALPWCLTNLQQVSSGFCAPQVGPLAILVPLLAAMCGAIGVWSERAGAASLSADADREGLEEGTTGAYRRMARPNVEDAGRESAGTRSPAFGVMIVGLVAALGVATGQVAFSIGPWIVIARTAYDCGCETSGGPDLRPKPNPGAGLGHASGTSAAALVP